MHSFCGMWRWVPSLAFVCSVAAGSRLVSGGKVLFDAEGNVTYSATVSELAVKATVACPAPTRVTIWCGRPPKNVFLNGSRFDPNAWRYDAATQCVLIPKLATGLSELQIRFDGLRSLDPIDAEIPITVCNAAWMVRGSLGAAKGLIENERVVVRNVWSGPDGMYRVRAVARDARSTGTPIIVNGLELTTVAGLPSNDIPRHELILRKGSRLSIQGKAPGMVVSVSRIDLQLVGSIVPTRRLPKSRLTFRNSLVVEGEDFSREGGGQVLRSTEHKNTRGGACIFTWADAGHWIAWDIDVPEDGNYVVTVVAATAEETALRSLRIDGNIVARAGLLEFTSTGRGWGRSDPDEWQPFQPADELGEPIRIPLTKGKHELRMENVVGQHMNVDCILLTRK